MLALAKNTETEDQGLQVSLGNMPMTKTEEQQTVSQFGYYLKPT